MSIKINSGTSAGFDQTSRISSKTVSENLYSDADPHNRTAFGYLDKTLSGKSEAAKTLQDFLTKVLKQQPIDENQRKRNVSVILEPNKPPSQMQMEDYQKAYFRALLKQAGHSNLPDADLNLIMNANTKQQTNFNLETLRREDARAGVLTVTVNKYSIELADRTAQAVSQFRQYQAGEVKAAIEKGNNYAKDAVGGFVQPTVNAPVNIINGISEPLRAGERVIFGTNKLPEIPRMTIAEKSEYWQKDGRSYAARGAEIGATILLGGAAGAKAVGTQAGRVLLGIESSYNIAAGTIGKDVTQTDEKGNARQMPMLERGLRITGGVLGARQTINAEINTPSSAVNKLDDVFGKRQAEMITPQGFRIRTSQTADELNAKIVSVDSNGKPSGTRFRDDYQSHIKERDFSKASQQSGVNGSHNLKEFEKYDIAVNPILTKHSIKILSKTPHPTVKGIYKVEYQMPKLDTKAQPTGLWRNKKGTDPFIKTIYDASIISDKQMAQWGREAFADAVKNGFTGKPSNRWEGAASNGLKFEGRVDIQGTSAVRTFYPIF